MKERVTLPLCTAALLLVASLVLAEIHPFGNPALSAMPASPHPPQDIPPQVQAILGAKCADCHSGPVRMPLYGHFAPTSWLIERDVVHARSVLDLSQWAAYSPERQETLRSKIAFEAKKRSMPPPQYLAMHWNARLSPEDIQILTRWAAHPVAASVAQTAMLGDPARGRVVFEKRCTGCHALKQDREGPHLQGVYGRTSGSVQGFDDSGALRNAHAVWSDATLDRWLADPDAFVPGNNMDFHVASPQERADLIRFLQRQQ